MLMLLLVGAAGTQAQAQVAARMSMEAWIPAEAWTLAANVTLPKTLVPEEPGTLTADLDLPKALLPDALLADAFLPNDALTADLALPRALVPDEPVAVKYKDFQRTQLAINVTAPAMGVTADETTALVASEPAANTAWIAPRKAEAVAPRRAFGLPAAPSAVLAQQDGAQGQAAGSGFVFHAPGTMAGPGGAAIEQAQDGPLRLSLDDAISLGLQRNVRMKFDRANQRAVKGYTLGVVNALVPNVTLDAQSSANELDLAAMGFKPATIAKFGLPPNSIPLIVKVDTTQAQLKLDQLLFSLPDYELYRGTKNEAAVVDLAELNDRGDVVLSVGMAYLQVLADQANFSNTQAQERSAKTVAEQAEAKRAAGVGINLDALRGKVAYQQRQQERVAAETQLAKDKIQLLRIMGMPAGQALELSDTAPFAELAEMDLESAKSTAYLRRKDLLGLQQQIALTDREVKAVKTQRLPTLAFNGYYGVIGLTTGLYHGSFVAEGTLKVPIFNEGAQRGEEQVVDSQLTSLRQREASLKVTIDAQIRSAMLDVAAADELVKVAKSNVGLAQQELSDARDRFSAGVDDDLPVVDAEASVAQAEAQLVRSLYQYNVAKLTLARSTGVIETRYRTYLGR
jgi:outer membrane protein TolC